MEGNPTPKVSNFVLVKWIVVGNLLQTYYAFPGTILWPPSNKSNIIFQFDEFRYTLKGNGSCHCFWFNFYGSVSCLNIRMICINNQLFQSKALLYVWIEEIFPKSRCRHHDIQNIKISSFNFPKLKLIINC